MSRLAVTTTGERLHGAFAPSLEPDHDPNSRQVVVLNVVRSDQCTLENGIKRLRRARTLSRTDLTAGLDRLSISRPGDRSHAPTHPLLASVNCSPLGGGIPFLDASAVRVIRVTGTCRPADGAPRLLFYIALHRSLYFPTRFHSPQ
jgi:hypothetical protein